MTDDKKTEKKETKKSTQKAVEKAHSQAVDVINAAPKGFENEDPKDLLLPRIELLQGLSPAVQEGKGKAGDLVNNITKAPLTSHTFTPITMQRKYIKWIPRSEGGGIEYQTSDPTDQRVIADTKWGPHGEKPTCTAYMNFLVLLEGTTMPIILSFSMTNYNEGKKLYTMAKMANCDMWLKKYTIGSKGRKNNMGTWHVFDIQEAGDTGEEEVKIASSLYEAFCKRVFNFEADGGETPKAPADKDEEF